MDTVASADAVVTESAPKRQRFENAFDAVPVLDNAPWVTYKADCYIVVPTKISEETSDDPELIRLPVHAVLMAHFPTCAAVLDGSWAISTRDVHFDFSDCEWDASVWTGVIRRACRFNPLSAGVDRTKARERFIISFYESSVPFRSEHDLFLFLLATDFPSLVGELDKCVARDILIPVFVNNYSHDSREDMLTFKDMLTRVDKFDKMMIGGISNCLEPLCTPRDDILPVVNLEHVYRVFTWLFLLVACSNMDCETSEAVINSCDRGGFSCLYGKHDGKSNVEYYALLALFLPCFQHLSGNEDKSSYSVAGRDFLLLKDQTSHSILALAGRGLKKREFAFKENILGVSRITQAGAYDFYSGGIKWTVDEKETESGVKKAPLWSQMLEPCVREPLRVYRSGMPHFIIVCHSLRLKWVE